MDLPKAMDKDEAALELENKLYKAVGKEREDEAREIVKLGRLSWKIRDDDNLFLSKIEAQLLRVIKIGLTFQDPFWPLLASILKHFGSQSAQNWCKMHPEGMLQQSFAKSVFL